MRPVTLSFTPAATSTTGLASSVTGATFTLTNTSMGDNLAHIVTILNNSSTDHSGKTLTITGQDADGNAQTETITGPGNAATVSSTKYYSVVTSVTVSATIGADTFSIGYTAVSVSKTVVLDLDLNPFNVGLGVIITGTLSATVQHCFEDVFSAFPSTRTWFPHASIAAVTSNTDGNYAFPCRATRLLLNSLTATATVKYVIIQAR